MKRIHGEEHPHTKIAVSNWARLVASRAADKAMATDNVDDKNKNKNKNRRVSVYARFKRKFHERV